MESFKVAIILFGEAGLDSGSGAAQAAAVAAPGGGVGRGGEPAQSWTQHLNSAPVSLRCQPPAREHHSVAGTLSIAKGTGLCKVSSVVAQLDVLVIK